MHQKTDESDDDQCPASLEEGHDILDTPVAT
jgi:hypothetical protein